MVLSPIQGAYIPPKRWFYPPKRVVLTPIKVGIKPPGVVLKVVLFGGGFIGTSRSRRKVGEEVAEKRAKGVKSVCRVPQKEGGVLLCRGDAGEVREEKVDEKKYREVRGKVFGVGMQSVYGEDLRGGGNGTGGVDRQKGGRGRDVAHGGGAGTARHVSTRAEGGMLASGVAAGQSAIMQADPAHEARQASTAPRQRVAILASGRDRKDVLEKWGNQLHSKPNKAGVVMIQDGQVERKLLVCRRK